LDAGWTATTQRKKRTPILVAKLLSLRGRGKRGARCGFVGRKCLIKGREGEGTPTDWILSKKKMTVFSKENTGHTQQGKTRHKKQSAKLVSLQQSGGRRNVNANSTIAILVRDCKRQVTQHLATGAGGKPKDCETTPEKTLKKEGNKLEGDTRNGVNFDSATGPS